MNTDLREKAESVDEQCNFWKNYGKCEKTFNIRTRLSYYKVFHITSIINRNENNTDTYQ